MELDIHKERSGRVEYITHWLSEWEHSVPPWAIMRVVQAYKSEGLKYAWEIVMVKPPGNSSMDWAIVASLEEEFVGFRRLVSRYRDISWIFRDETRLLASWRQIERILERYGLSLPPLQLDENYWQEREEKEKSRKVRAAQKRNLRKLRKATKTLEETLMPLRDVRLSAYRFMVRGTKKDNALVWNYPTRMLRWLGLPLFKNRYRIKEEPMTIRGEENLTRLLVEVFSEDLLQPMIWGWPDESTGKIEGRLTGHEKRYLKAIAAKSIEPYTFAAPLVSWKEDIAQSDVLPKSAMEWLSQVRQNVSLRLRLRMKDRNGDWLDLQMEMPPLAVVGWEDGGIWQEYHRIQYACENGERMEGLGTIEGGKPLTPVTEIYGAHSLIVWNWALYERRYMASLLSDQAMCPKCGKLLPRKKGQWRERICHDCASAGHKRVIRYRAKKKESSH